MKKILLTLICFTTIFIAASDNPVLGSDSFVNNNDTLDRVSFSLNADIVSRFVWRGLPLDLHANIQPGTSVSFKNITLGAWGSYAFSNNFAEVDLFLSYDIGAFTFAVFDYYNEDETDLSFNNYFQFSDKGTRVTPHSVEGQISFNGTENLPVSISLGTFIYGNDRDAENKNCYSTYLELGYEHNIGENTLSYFLGGTITEGFYAEKAAIVNLGFKAARELNLSETASFPISASLIINPYAKDIFFVFGLTF